MSIGKRSLVIAAACVLAGVFIVGESAEAKRKERKNLPLTIEIAAKSTNVILGQSPRLSLLFRNTGPSSVSIPTPDAIWSKTPVVHVQRPGGGEHASAKADFFPREEEYRDDGQVISPQGELKVEILDKQAPLPVPGTYSVWATYERDGVQISSNKIRLTVSAGHLSSLCGTTTKLTVLDAAGTPQARMFMADMNGAPSGQPELVNLGEIPADIWRLSAPYTEDVAFPSGAAWIGLGGERVLAFNLLTRPMWEIRPTGHPLDLLTLLRKSENDPEHLTVFVVADRDSHVTIQRYDQRDSTDAPLMIVAPLTSSSPRSVYDLGVGTKWLSGQLIHMKKGAPHVVMAALVHQGLKNRVLFLEERRDLRWEVLSSVEIPEGEIVGRIALAAGAPSEVHCAVPLRSPTDGSFRAFEIKAVVPSGRVTSHLSAPIASGATVGHFDVTYVGEKGGPFLGAVSRTKDGRAQLHMSWTNEPLPLPESLLGPISDVSFGTTFYDYNPGGRSTRLPLWYVALSDGAQVRTVVWAKEDPHGKVGP